MKHGCAGYLGQPCLRRLSPRIVEAKDSPWVSSRLVFLSMLQASQAPQPEVGVRHVCKGKSDRVLLQPGLDLVWLRSLFIRNFSARVFRKERDVPNTFPCYCSVPSTFFTHKSVCHMVKGVIWGAVHRLQWVALWPRTASKNGCPYYPAQTLPGVSEYPWAPSNNHLYFGEEI